MESLFPFIFMLVGLGALGYGAALVRRARESEHWPSVLGEITRSEVAVDHDDDAESEPSFFGHSASHSGSGFLSHRAQRTQSRLFRTVIEYTYEVEGRRYHSDQVSAGGLLSLSWRGPAERRCARYRRGRQVAVHYRPGDPRMACLEHGVQGALLVGAVGAVFTIFSVIMLVDRFA